MADHIKHRFRGSLQEWLQLLVVLLASIASATVCSSRGR
jgi:hypothetical protein